MENANEVIKLWLKVAIDDGMAVPEPKPLAELTGIWLIASPRYPA